MIPIYLIWGLNMSEALRKLYYSASNIKNVILEDNNIDILLFLAKYNPEITKKNIVKNFGEESLEGLKHLEICNLVKEEKERLTLTEEGIFQVEGLLSIVV